MLVLGKGAELAPGNAGVMTTFDKGLGAGLPDSPQLAPVNAGVMLMLESGLGAGLPDSPQFAPMNAGVTFTSASGLGKGLAAWSRLNMNWFAAVAGTGVMAGPAIQAMHRLFNIAA